MTDIEFIETPVFTQVITKLLEDNEYGDFQNMLASNLEAGNLIPGGGGLRKVRWRSSNHLLCLLQTQVIHGLRI